MPLDHASVKIPGQPLFAVVDWNANHVITGGVLDIGANNFIVDTNVLHVNAATDRVGMGTTIPGADLEIARSSLNTEQMISVYSAIADIPLLTLFKSNSATIGTYTPTQDGDNLGYVRFQGVDSGNNRDYGSYIMSAQDGAVGTRVPSYLAFGTSTNLAVNERMRITKDGYVGIGVTIPLQKLHINAGRIRLDDNFSIGWGGTQSQILGNNAGDWLALQTNATDRIRIITGGNVGIGTPNPLGILHVRKDQAVSTLAYFENQNTANSVGLLLSENAAVSYAGIVRYGSTNPLANALDITTTDGGHVLLRPSGNVAINETTPGVSCLLHLTSTTGALLLTRMTTGQRDALTAVNGMILYNTTTNKIEGREAGAWVDI